jgi:two-component system, OmpR family, response regulator QseB
MQVAIAEPDLPMADVLAHALRRGGHRVLAVTHPQRLFERLAFLPEVIVLAGDRVDQELLALVEQARRSLSSAVVFLTIGRVNDVGTIAALRAGAHDVLRKPYNPYELVLRAEAWTARASAPKENAATARLADLTVALDQYTATKNGVSLPLTRLELRLLYCLCVHQPHLVPIERLLAFAWNDQEEPGRALLRTHLSHLRDKLRAAGGIPLEIRSRQALGYLLRPADQDAAGEVRRG